MARNESILARMVRCGLPPAVLMAAVQILPHVAFAQSVSAPLTVGAVVVRSCSVETQRTAPLSSVAKPVTSTGQTVKIRCGANTVVYPPQPGSAPSLMSNKDVRPVVSATPDGRIVTIQF